MVLKYCCQLKWSGNEVCEMKILAPTKRVISASHHVFILILNNQLTLFINTFDEASLLIEEVSRCVSVIVMVSKLRWKWKPRNDGTKLWVSQFISLSQWSPHYQHCPWWHNPVRRTTLSEWLKTSIEQCFEHFYMYVTLNIKGKCIFYFFHLIWGKICFLNYFVLCHT